MVRLAATSETGVPNCQISSHSAEIEYRHGLMLSGKYCRTDDAGPSYRFYSETGSRSP